MNGELTPVAHNNTFKKNPNEVNVLMEVVSASGRTPRRTLYYKIGGCKQVAPPHLKHHRQLRVNMGLLETNLG